MRLVTLDSREVGGRPGLLLSSGEILDLAASPTGLAAAQWRPQSVVSILAQGAEGQAHVARLLAEYADASESQRGAWRSARRLLPGAGTRLLPPIRRPGLLLMLPDASAQQRGIYIKNPNSAVGPDAGVGLPDGTERPLHLLGMLGLTLGRPLFRCSEAEALRALTALTLIADLGTRPFEPSARTSASGPDHGSDTAARQFPGACVLGPALVTLDEVTNDWTPALKVNGRSLAAVAPPAIANPAAAARLLTRLAERYAFRPGDVVGVSAGIPEIELPAGSSVVLSLGSDLALPFSITG